MLRQRLIISLTAIVITLMFAATSFAVPPSPEAIEKWQAEGILEQKLTNWRIVDKVDAYISAELSHDAEKFRSKTSLAGTVDTVFVVVALVEFEDHLHSEEPWEFDSLLFSVRGEGGYNNPTGSWTDFYLENSYGKFFVKGIISGWHMMPKLYSYYVGANDGDFAAELAYEAALATDTAVDYSVITEVGDYAFSGFIVVHAGAGAEAGGYGIWSHKGSVSGSVTLDGIRIDAYTMNPEKYSGGISTMGVFAHEYGHALGLPDLYDTNYEPAGSDGLGRWAMMAGGSWNGFERGGDTPSHFCAWSKVFLGFVETIELVFNSLQNPNPISILQAEIPQIESEPVIYRLVNDEFWGEYWLVENRQKVGFDTTLPGAGLCIYHIDTYESGNDVPGSYRVALEQADGLDALAYGGSGTSGDAGDPYPGTTNNRNFNNITTPDSKTHLDQVSEIGVWNISDSDSLMYADLEAGYSHPWPVFYADNPIQFSDPAPGGNGNGVMEPGEIIEFRCRLTNTMARSFDPWISLTVDFEGIVFTRQYAKLDLTAFNPLKDYHENEYPLLFTIPEGIDPVNVTFTLKLTSDNDCCGSSEFDFVSTWDLPRVLGQPKVLIVDDDGGENYDLIYRQYINEMNLAYGIWDKSVTAPTGADLAGYEIVLWISGHPTTAGTITTDDVTAMTEYLENNGNLAIISASAALELNNVNPGFMANYLHASYAGAGALGLDVVGYEGSTLGDALSFKYDGSFGFGGNHQELTAVGTAEEAFWASFYNSNNGTIGVSYSGLDYKAITLTTPLEFFDNTSLTHNTGKELLARVIYFFDGVTTDVADEFTNALPTGFALDQNYPNPFNPTTTISYTVDGNGSGGLLPVRLDIFNILGQNIETLVDRSQIPGFYSVEWDGRDESGSKVASGVYLYRLTQGDKSETKKMLLLK